ncbi:MAG: hypothetical protein FWG87_02965 [Defluviitaleaceae bacterium]|nr:hypothetical protein [Defluviitaleaceae bacterium]
MSLFSHYKNIWIKHGFNGFTHILQIRSWEIREIFSHEPIRVIRVNPPNPCLIHAFQLRAFIAGTCRGRIYPSRGYLALRWSACGVV